MSCSLQAVVPRAPNRPSSIVRPTQLDMDPSSSPVAADGNGGAHHQLPQFGHHSPSPVAPCGGRRRTSPLGESSASRNHRLSATLGASGGTVAAAPQPPSSAPSSSVHAPPRPFLPQSVDAMHAAQVELLRSRIQEKTFWSLRTLYPAPIASSASQCVLQNEMLTRFGGLMPECADLLYIVITKSCALRPSCCQLYLKECEKHRTMPIPVILNQLYTTPGRYSMHELSVSGHPLGVLGAKVIAPVIAANTGLTSLAMRACNLSEGTALFDLLDAMTNLQHLESLDLSCNRLTDAMGHSAALLEFISSHPQLVHIGLGKNELSSESLRRIRAALAVRSEPTAPEPTSPSGGGGESKVVPPPDDGCVSSNMPHLQLPLVQSSPRSGQAADGGAGAKSPPPTGSSSPRYASVAARVNSCRHGCGNRRAASPPAPQALTLIGVDHIEVSVPAIPEKAFFAAINMYIALMARQLGQLEMSVFASKLPHAFEVYRKQCGSTNAEYVTLLQYLEASFPSCGRKRMLHTLKAYSQFSLVAPVRRPTKETLRKDQREEINSVFRALDRTGQGVLPVSVLNPLNATEEEVQDTNTMLERLGITQLNSEALAVLMAPYVVEVRKRKRFR
jgi:hypothetical protein